MFTNKNFEIFNLVKVCATHVCYVSNNYTTHLRSTFMHYLNINRSNQLNNAAMKDIKRIQFRHL
jgi:hypothetical protein